ncbi:MAG TPA: BrnT family toxin [Thermoanaerobaculia bacterium]|nr:BrnT family toxin [Thermoanaerobaculia bacterium]
MIHYKFDWDEEKARLNERKHGVTFTEATSCFMDVFAIESFDVIHSTDEDRFVLSGMSDRGRVLVVAFTLRGNAIIRIISARKALRKERIEYERQAYF